MKEPAGGAPCEKSTVFPCSCAPQPFGGAAEVVSIAQTVPAPLQSVIDPGPPPASWALICSTTALLSMVAALSILLRPLLPTASISSPITASMPKISTNPAISNSITVMPDSERFPRYLLVGMCLVPPTRAIPIPTLYAASRRNAGGGPAGSASAVVPEVVNKTRGGITHTRDRIGKARQPA